MAAFVVVISNTNLPKDMLKGALEAYLESRGEVETIDQLLDDGDVDNGEDFDVIHFEIKKVS